MFCDENKSREDNGKVISVSAEAEHQKTAKEKIVSFFFPKWGQTSHSPFYKIMILILIFTSEMESCWTALGMRPLYSVVIAVSVVLILEKIISGYITGNKYFLAFIGFLFLWGAYALVQGVFITNTLYYEMFIKGIFFNIFLVFVLIDFVRNIEDIRFLMYCFIAYITLCLVIGVFEIIGDVHVVNVRDTSHWLPHSFYWNENDNAAVLVSGAYVMLMCLFEAKEKKWRIILAVMIAVTVFETVMTKSRAAILGLIVLSLFTALFALLVRVARRSKRTYRIIVISGVALFVLAIATVFMIFTPDELVELLSGDGNKESDSLRFNLVFSGIRSVFETYGLGLGAGQSITLNGINLHNFYLELISEYGIVIGGIFCAFVIGIMFDLKGDPKNERNIFTDALIRSYPIVLAVIGIGPSSALILRPMWMVLVMAFTMKYVNGPQIWEGRKVSDN